MSTQHSERLFLSVVVPAYNEEDRLTATLNAVWDYLSRYSRSFEIIVVDDGSTDRTSLVAEQFCRQRGNCTLLKNPVNGGKGFSIKRGISCAEGEFILFSDADLSTPIEEVEKLLPALRNGSCDIAIASRAEKDSIIRVPQPWFRSLMGKFFNVLVRLLATKGIGDTQCGFKCFKRDVAKRVFKQQRLTRFGFDVEILYIAQKAGYVIQEFPIRWINSPDSRVRVLRDSFNMFCDLWRIRWNDWKGCYETTRKYRSNGREECDVPGSTGRLKKDPR